VAEHAGSFRLVIGDGAIARLLNITGLIGVFAVYRSLEDAQQKRDRVQASL
jgi:hypothetical protein